MDGITKHTLPFSLTQVAAAVVIASTSALGYHYACLSRSKAKNEYREIPLATGSIPYFGKERQTTIYETTSFAQFNLYRTFAILSIH